MMSANEEEEPSLVKANIKQRVYFSFEFVGIPSILILFMNNWVGGEGGCFMDKIC